MADKRYVLTYFPKVVLGFDSKGNLLSHDIDLSGVFANMFDVATNTIKYQEREAEDHMGKIVYQSIIERLGTLALTEFYQHPDDEPF
jgi:hypothetical protein